MIQVMNPINLGNSMQRYYAAPPFSSTNNSANNSSNPNVLSNSLIDLAQSTNGSASLYNSGAYMNTNEEKIKQNRLNPMSILTNQGHIRSGHNMPGSHLHSPNHQQLINSSFTPAVIAAAATALQAMGVNPNHPQYAQIIQNQFQNPAQQFSQIQHFQAQFQQNLHNNNGENGFVKKEPNIPVMIPTPPPTINPSSTLTQITTSSQQPSQSDKSNSTPSSLSSTTVSQTSNPTSSTPQPSVASYIPQVEAISPTPEDQKENTNIASLKHKINEDLEKVDRDIANTQYQLESLEKKKVCDINLKENFKKSHFLKFKQP